MNSGSPQPARPPVILLTGFGPFPGAPFNPTGPLVHRLARIRRPRLADVRRPVHVFPTAYRAIDQDLPRLLAELTPDAVLMFGLAGRSRGLRIETRARNAISLLLCDAEGSFTAGTSIVKGAPSALRFAASTQTLVSAARAVRVSAQLSRDAGRYLCNYLSWRAIEATGRQAGSPLMAFVHVPKPRRARRCRRPPGRPVPTMEELVRGGQAILLAMISAVRRRRTQMEKP